MRRRTAVVAASLLGSSVIAGALGAGHADAAIKQQYVAMNCYSLNPNIVDFPYHGGATATWDTKKPGTFTLHSDSKSFFPYVTNSTITVTNLRTGKSQTVKRTWQHGLGDNSGYRITDLRGSGPTKITLNAVNHGLLPNLPARTCSGVVNL